MTKFFYDFTTLLHYFIFFVTVIKSLQVPHLRRKVELNPVPKCDFKQCLFVCYLNLNNTLSHHFYNSLKLLA